MTVVTRLVKAVVGLVAGFFLGAIVGVMVGLVAWLGVMLFSPDVTANVIVTVAGTLVGAATGAILFDAARTYADLFAARWGKIPIRVGGALVGAPLGFLLGNDFAGMQALDTLALYFAGWASLLLIAYPAFFIGGLLGALTGVLAGFWSQPPPDRDEARTKQWDAFYEKRRRGRA
jgi:hypothetical protein